MAKAEVEAGAHATGLRDGLAARISVELGLRVKGEGVIGGQRLPAAQGLLVELLDYVLD